MNVLTEKKELHDQVKHLEKLVARLYEAIKKARTPLEADHYCNSISDLIGYVQISVAMKPKAEAEQDIKFVREFLSQRIDKYENPVTAQNECLREIQSVGPVRVKS